MKQVIQSYRTGELWLAEVPAPANKGGGAVVRSTSSLVSAGTERMIIDLAKKSLIGKARARPDLVKKVIAKIKTEGLKQTMTKVFAKLDEPIPLGYSLAGVIEETGHGVTGLAPEQRVACAGAGYATHAEYNFVPTNLIVPIPDAVSDDDAAFTTLGSIAMQGVRQADVRVGERVVVIGAGLLGLLSIQILKAAGCFVLATDVDPKKCELASQFGADQTAVGDVENAVAAFTEGYGADVVLITAATSSNGPIELAAEIAKMKGRIVSVGNVGLNIPRDPFYKKELDLRLSMSYGPGRYDPSYEEGGNDYPFAYVRWTERRNMQAFLHLVSEGKVNPAKLVSHRFSVDNALKAYELLEGKGESAELYLGILIDYNPPSLSEIRDARKVVLAPAALGIGSGKIGVSFIGAGNFAKGVLLPAIGRQSGVTLRSICTTTGRSASETGKKHGFAIATTDMSEVLNDKDTHCVFIATPHSSHAALVCQCLHAGKHVFVEKPLALNEDQLQQIIGTVAELGDKCPMLTVGFNRRHSSHAAAIARFFKSCGTPKVVNTRINAGVIPKDNWQQDPDVGGGRIIGEVCHWIDLNQYFVDSPPRKVYAACIQSSSDAITPEDSVVITIEHQNGSLSTIQYLAHGSTQVPKERIEVVADGKTALLDNFTRTTFSGDTASPVKGAQDKGFDQEMAAFFKTARNGGDWPIPFESLVATTRVTHAALQSLRTGKPVILDQ